MGIPDELDLECENLPVKAKQSIDSYRNVDNKASLVKFAPTPSSQGQYGTCVVGYDDNFKEGMFHIQNSWGDDWADGGRIWVYYLGAAKFIYQANELFKLLSLAKKPTTALSDALEMIDLNGQPMQTKLKENTVLKLKNVYRSGK